MVLLFALALAEPAVPPPPVPADYELQWHAPAECPAVDALRMRIAALRGDERGGDGVAIVNGEVVHDDDGFALVLTTTFAERTHVRTMSAPSCDELAESTAIVVAVALRNGVEAAMTEPTPTPAAPAPAAAATSEHEPVAPTIVDAPPPTPAPTLRRPPPGDPFARIEGLGEIGALGVITGGARLTLGLDWRRARAELYGLYLAPRRRGLPDKRGGLFQAGAIGARGCWVARRNALELPLCAGFEAGTVRVDNRKISPRKTLHTTWAGPLVGIGVAYTVGPVRLWLGAEMVVRVAGSRFRIDGQVAFRQLPVSLRWSLGLEIPLGRRNDRRGRKNPAIADTGGSGGAR
ncbi:MAG TPA: hypothetical protein VG755_10080 [Nannocystaceae bacterium]|nr:hypothetical protein [Nannocystaceae bacterium]